MDVIYTVTCGGESDNGQIRKRVWGWYASYYEAEEAAIENIFRGELHSLDAAVSMISQKTGIEIRSLPEYRIAYRSLQQLRNRIQEKLSNGG